MSVVSAIRRLVAQGFTYEQALDAAEAFEAETEAAPVRSPAAIRQARYRNRKRNNRNEVTRDVTRDAPSQGSPPSLAPQTPLNPSSPPNPTPPPPSPPKGGSSPVGFGEFWAIYPNRVGKRDAERAFATASKRAPLEAILAGLRRYAAKTDDRPWCNPATWLNQDRWEDAPATVAQRSTGPPLRQSPLAALYRATSQGPEHEPDFHEGINRTGVGAGFARSGAGAHGREDQQRGPAIDVEPLRNRGGTGTHGR